MTKNTLTLDFKKETEFENNHLYSPKDVLKKRYLQTMTYWKDLLPKSFENGDLEIKKTFKRQIKEVPLLSKLINKDYENDVSKSDNNIAKIIKFFTNNLPSFKKYKTVGNLSYIIDKHRLLIIEILEQGQKNHLSITTIKTRLNSILRIFYIAYQEKNYAIYQKISFMVLSIGFHFNIIEKNNKLSDFEKKKHLPFELVLKKQMEMEQIFANLPNKQTLQAYDFNNDLLLISLYTLIGPLRNEIKALDFTTTSQRVGDYIHFGDNEILLELNNLKKKHEAITLNISQEAPRLASLLKESWVLYPRKSVFTVKKKYPQVDIKAGEATLSNRLINIFKTEYPDVNVSVNSLRSSYISYKYLEALKAGTLLTCNEKEELATKMRTSLKYIEMSYLKIPDNHTIVIKKMPTVSFVIDEETSYNKQLNRSKQYYMNNKEKISKMQKAYQDNISAFDKTRIKLLHYLNCDLDYHKKMRPSTFEKYSFKQDGSKWV